jgi:serine/threonine-protein kinase
VEAIAFENSVESFSPTTGSARLQPGVVLQGTYRILRSLAAGGMGEVYLATHERLRGAFAVKVLHRELIRDADALTRFRGEAEIMAGLRHPNVVQVFDFNVTPEGLPYLVMELVDGKDLGAHLRVGQPMPPRQVAHIIHQIASALEAAHAHGVVHRDLKPENVMLLSIEGQEDFVKVLDFGISKARWSHRITSDSEILGTPQFMAPEQAQGRREEIDHRTDQFALASMAYSLLTGCEPFRGDTAVAILYQVVHQDAEPLARHLAWPSARTEAVLRRGMAKEREARFSTVLDFAHALEGAIAQDLSGAQPAGRTPRSLTPLRLAAADLAVIVPQPSRRSCESTARMRPLRRGSPRRTMARVLGAAAAIAMAFYLDAVGWDSVGSVVGVAYRSAAAATSWTISQLHAGPPPVTQNRPGGVDP